MKNFSKILLGAFLATVLGFAVLGLAASGSGYNGFNPLTGLEGVRGTLIDNALDIPTIAQTGQTISAQKGSANAGQWTATGATTGAGTLTFVNAATNGRACLFSDLTTNADKITQTTATDGKTVVTIAGTIVSGDVINYQCFAY